MKHLTRRTRGAVVGVLLGWYVAGIVLVGPSSVVPGAGASYARASEAHQDDDPHDGHAHGAEDSLSIHDTDGGHGTGAGHTADVDHDAAYAAAGRLVPQPQDIPWFGPVLYAAGGLFVGAVVLGIPALKLRGPEPTDPSDPADTHSH